MLDNLNKLIIRWRKDAQTYQKQVEESLLKNLPHDQMLSMATCLRSCANDLEKITKEVKS